MASYYADDGGFIGTTATTDVQVERQLQLANQQAVSAVNYSANSTSTRLRLDDYLSLDLQKPTVNTKTTSTDTSAEINKMPTADYKWNLPPHNWSLPVRPRQMDSELVGENNYDAFHGMRRGRIWYYSGANNVSTFDDSGNVTTAGATAAKNTGTKNTDAGTVLSAMSNHWGFQFMWNPTSISTSVTRNMDITPSPADSLKVVSGAFPGQETVSLTLQLDRVNDFACIKAYGGGNDPKGVNYSQFTSYYDGNSYPIQSSEITTSDKIQQLMAQGTMADLEYLFKTLNGGQANGGWTNLLGKETANIGFLMPTLIGLQIGPTLDSLSYVGWITTMGIQHTDFTENMIPVRTTVSLSIDCFSGSGIVAGN